MTDRVSTRIDQVGGLAWHSTAHGPAGGDPVVVVHGLGAAGEAQQPVARRLAGRFRVLVPDLPGFGRSQHPDDVPGPAELGGLLAGWLEAMGLSAPLLVANSMGCQVVAHLAARRPGLVRGLVLQGPTVDAAARSGPRQAVRLALDGRYERASLGLLQARGVKQTGLRRFAASFRAALADRIEEVVTTVTCPVLVVRGGRDVVVPQRWAETVTACAGQGDLRVVPGVGHCMVYSAPVELSRIVADFAAGLGGDVENAG